MLRSPKSYPCFRDASYHRRRRDLLHRPDDGRRNACPCNRMGDILSHRRGHWDNHFTGCSLRARHHCRNWLPHMQQLHLAPKIFHSEENCQATRARSSHAFGIISAAKTFHSKKGYASFVLFFLLSLILLTPFILRSQNQSPPSLASAFSAQEALNSHLSLSRSIAPIAQQAYDESKPALYAPTESSSLTDDEKEQIVRAAILQKWSDFETSWNENSGANSNISCAPSGVSQSQYFPAPENLSPSLFDFWQSCQNNIQFYYIPSRPTPKIVISRVVVESFYSNTNASVKTELSQTEID